MAIDKTPVLKRCRSLGMSPAFVGVMKESHRQPKRQFKKKSEYGMQLAVNGKRLDIPSALVKAGDVVSVMEGSRSSAYFKGMAETLGKSAVPAWISVDGQNLSGKVDRLPVRDEIDVPIEEQLIIELYSK